MSSNETISSGQLRLTLERLKCQTTHSSTVKNYYSIWKAFNAFIIRLDKIPETWENRVGLYTAYLVDKGLQSSTLKSYCSAIKKILHDDGYELDMNKLVLNSITKACSLVNDRLKVHLPIYCNLLEVLLFELERLFNKQYYLEILYKTILLLGYYGMLRIGEVCHSKHSIKTKNVNIGQNKNKILLILYSSKTHDVESHPQHVKITEIDHESSAVRCKYRFFCPFKMARKYFALRPDYLTDSEDFFVFRDGSPIPPSDS